MEPKLEYIVMELAPKSSFVAELPFSVDNFEGDVLVGWSGVKSQYREILVVIAGSL